MSMTRTSKNEFRPHMRKAGVSQSDLKEGNDPVDPGYMHELRGFYPFSRISLS
jgi:hypothetical protein